MNAMQNAGCQSRHGRLCSRACGAVARKDRGAFTLVELLVVIAIIALLVSILLPSLVGARRAAWSVVCSSNQRQLGIAVANYIHDDKKERFPNINVNGFLYQVGMVGLLQPHLGGETDKDFGTDFASMFAWQGQNPVKQQEAFNCPAARGLSSTREPANIQYLGGTRIFAAPFPGVQMGEPIVRWSEYWFNDSAPRYGVVGGQRKLLSGVSGLPISQIKNYNWVVVSTDALDEFPRHSGQRLGSEAQGSNFGARSSGANNFLFGDGHVQSMTFFQYYLSADRFGAPAPFYNFGHAAPQ